MRSTDRKTERRPSTWWHGPLVHILFVVLRLLFVPATEPVLHPDSYVYMSEANQSYSELLASFAGKPTWRPATYPLFLKLCGVQVATDVIELRRAVLLQVLITSLAFAAFSLALARHGCRTRGGRVVMICILALLSLTIFVGPWDGAILSESLSLSILLMICTAVVSLRGARAVPPTAETDAVERESNDTNTTSLRYLVVLPILCALTALFQQLRDAHVPIVAFLSSLMVIFFVVRFRRWSRPVRIATVLSLAILAGLSLAQSRAAIASGRADWPLTNALSLRVWQVPGGFEAFTRDYGLPATLQPFVGRFVWDGWRDQPEYMNWLAERGRQSYLQFLLSNPAYIWQEANAAFRFAAEDATGNELERYFHAPESSPPLRLHLARATTDLLTLPQRLLTAALGYHFFWPILGCLIILAAVILLREQQIGLLAAGTVLALQLFVQVLTTIFLDACEDSRHNVLAYFVMVLLFWSPVVILIDDIAARREAAD